MNAVILSKTIDLPWTAMAPMRLGEVPSTFGTPDLYGLVSTASGPQLRLDIYCGSCESQGFLQAAFWNGFAVLGFGEQLHLIGVQSKLHFEFKLGSYFGSLWLGEALLLAASAEHVYCIDSNGVLCWRSPQLGIDGVVMLEVANQVLHGRGEWDPPGGWKDFMLSLKDGTLLPAP